MADRKKLELTQVELRAARSLQRLRNAKRFSVRGLSEEVSKLKDSPAIGPNAISQIENEGRRMTISDSWALARALKVSPLEFYLPIDGSDGAEFVYNDLDWHGENVLALRVIRHLYRLPDESAHDRWRQIAEQTLKSQIGPKIVEFPASNSSPESIEIIARQLLSIAKEMAEKENDQKGLTDDSET
ncbi:hypothetical protein CGLAR1_09750 [Corynebacterium glutamicum]|uniref:helix-turn-helix domain-containing protein n=1 Tax=Corynebacterium glutamicum TaxID=1718 RepID=UPI0004F78E97|nr:helix-turn-helix transcriptional regulator [Corynebacterium glutamicum]AIK85523.1 hypothetical protein CGLAR1_09750 [Corynebacterium glutamicum]AIK88308.1 hypothetical protein AR0_09900 [Corynebacterium glutamicum]